MTLLRGRKSGTVRLREDTHAPETMQENVLQRSVASKEYEMQERRW